MRGDADNPRHIPVTLLTPALRTSLYSVKSVPSGQQLKVAPPKPTASVDAIEEIKSGTINELYSMLKAIPTDQYSSTHLKLLKGSVSDSIRQKCKHGKFWISLDPNKKIRFANRVTMMVTIGDYELEFEAGVMAYISHKPDSEYLVQLHGTGDQWTQFTLLDVQFIKYVKPVPQKIRAEVEEEEVEEQPKAAKRDRVEQPTTETAMIADDTTAIFDRIIVGTVINLCDDQPHFPPDKMPDNNKVWLSLDYTAKCSPGTIRDFEFQHDGQLCRFKAKVYTQKNCHGSMWLQLVVGTSWTVFTVLTKDRSQKRLKVQPDSHREIAQEIAAKPCEKLSPNRTIETFDLFWHGSSVHSVFFDIIEGAFPYDLKVLLDFTI
jgi:hypothetical protein